MTDVAMEDLRTHAEQAAQMLKSLAHPERLMILCQLVSHEQCVGDLLKNTQLSQSAFSQHLSVLRKHHLVKTRKEAQTIYYDLADEKAIQILALLHQLYC